MEQNYRWTFGVYCLLSTGEIVNDNHEILDEEAVHLNIQYFIAWWEIGPYSGMWVTHKFNFLVVKKQLQKKRLTVIKNSRIIVIHWSFENVIEHLTEELLPWCRLRSEWNNPLALCGMRLLTVSGDRGMAWESIYCCLGWHYLHWCMLPMAIVHIQNRSVLQNRHHCTIWKGQDGVVKWKMHFMGYRTITEPLL